MLRHWHRRHLTVQLSDADPEQLGNPCLRCQTLRSSTETQPAKPMGLLGWYRIGFGIGRRSPTESGKCLEEDAVGAGPDDVQLFAAVRDRLRADTEQLFQFKQLTKG